MGRYRTAVTGEMRGPLDEVQIGGDTGGAQFAMH